MYTSSRAYCMSCLKRWYDPFVIAECLARPVLVERTLATVASVKKSWVAKPETPLPVTTTAVSANYTLPVIASPSGGCIDDTWTPPAAPMWHHSRARSHRRVDRQRNDSLGWLSRIVEHGGKYDPITDSWTATSIVNAPAVRESHTAVWTGSAMIVWGGYSAADSNTGGRYNPVTDSGRPTSLTNAPAGRYSHTAVWTGSQMIVWGGYAADTSTPAEDIIRARIIGQPQAQPMRPRPSLAHRSVDRQRNDRLGRI